MSLCKFTSEGNLLRDSADQLGRAEVKNASAADEQNNTLIDSEQRN